MGLPSIGLVVCHVDRLLLGQARSPNSASGGGLIVIAGSPHDQRSGRTCRCSALPAGGCRGRAGQPARGAVPGYRPAEHRQDGAEPGWWRRLLQDFVAERCNSHHDGVIVLTYHQAACEQLGIEPEVTPETLARTDRFEHQHETRLPAAVREWYGVHQADIVLRRSDRIPVDDLGQVTPYPEWYNGQWGQAFEGDDPHLLVIGADRESGLAWAVQSDGDANPPVLVGWVDEPAAPQWTAFTDSFSDFVFARAWDWRSRRLPHRLEARYVDSDEIDDALQADGFRRLPYFHTPGSVPVRRFDAPRQRISINNDWTGDWILAADTSDDLRDLVMRVCRYHALSNTLHVPDGSHAGTLLAQLNQGG
jgi:hypothetical protein